MASFRAFVYRNLFKFRNWRIANQPPATVEQARAGLDAAGATIQPAAGVEIVPADLDGGSGKLYAEWYKASASESANDKNIILYLHGGGYRNGSCMSHRGFVTHIAKAAEADILLPEYRLAPENKFPAALEDARAVYESLLDNGIRPDQITIGGDSAGGGLALALLLNLRDDARPLPNGAFVISPWTDLASTGESIKTKAKLDPWLTPDSSGKSARSYYGDDSATNPLVSPLYGEYKHIPPLLIQVGTHEILLDDSTRLAKRATNAGVKVDLKVYRGMWHVWHAFIGRGIPECQQAIDEIGKFVIERSEARN